MSLELIAAIDELTRDAAYTTRNEVYDRYFRDADWNNFNKMLWLLAMDGLATSRRHPQIDGDRLVALTEEGRALSVHRRD